MPFNGSGTFIPIAPPNYPAVAGQPVFASQFNANMTDLFSGFDNCITRDGQSPATANIPMGSNKLTGLAQPSALGDALAWGRAGSITNGTFTAAITPPGVGSSVGVASRNSITWIDTARAADGRIAEFVWDSGVLNGRFINDAYAAGESWLQVVGTSAAVSYIDFGEQNFRVTPLAGAVNYLNVVGSTGVNAVRCTAAGTATDLGINYESKAQGVHNFYGGTVQGPQFQVNPVSGALRYLAVSGSVAGNPSIVASAGSIALGSDVQGSTATFSGAVATGTLSITQGAIISGTYTPTLTNGANVNASTPSTCSYLRVGNVVTVSGNFSISTTAAAGTFSTYDISLPIASNLGALGDLAGTQVRLIAGTVQYESGIIFANTGSDRATVQFNSAAAANNTTSFTFTYRII